MGNKHCVPPRPIIIPPPTERPVGKEKEVKIVRSLSNPSLQSHVEEQEMVVDTSTSQQFNLEYMTIIYSKFYSLLGMTNDLIPIEVIKSIATVLETIASDESVVNHAAKFGETIVKLDDSALTQYLQFADRNPLKYAANRGVTTEKRIVTHAMFVFRTLKIIASAIDEGKLEMALEILNSLALSHSIMRVSSEEFHEFAVKIVRNLIHTKVLSDELLGAFVYFNMNLIHYIEKCSDAWQSHHYQLIRTMQDPATAPARVYYRDLKQWRTYVLGLYKTLAKALEEYEKPRDASAKMDAVQMTAKETEEHWKIITILKRGYKYRSKSDEEIF